MKVCMIAYAQYSHDARIKRYVKTIEGNGGLIDVLVLKEGSQEKCEKIGNARIFYLTEKYQGANRLLYVWSYLVYFIACFLKVTSLSMKGKYTAVHVNNMPNFIIFTAIVPKLLGAKIILDVHDLMTTNYMAKFGENFRNKFLVSCLIFEQKISAMMANQVLCADHMQKEYLKTVCKIPNKKILVMMNLPDDEVFKPIKKIRTDDKFRLVYHGTIAKRLGIDIMIVAMSKIRNIIPVHLSIYGSGDFLKEAMDLADKLDLSENIYFSGSFFPTEMIPAIVSCMDLGIIANRKTLATDKYMMPVKLMEYTYLQIPVVAPRLKIIQSYFDEEMIKYYEAEDIDDLANCIVDLYLSPEKRKILTLNASNFFKKHNWKRQAEAYIKCLA